MSKLKKAASKTWAFGAAAAIILGSSSAMAFALNRNAFAATTVPSATKHVHTASNPPQSSTTGYIVVDESTNPPSQPPAYLVDKWNLEGINTKQQIQQKYSEWIASHTPGAKNMSAQQAAAYAAPIVQKAYGLDLKGYTAKANFQSLPIPGNSTQWVVTFYPPNDSNVMDGYTCTVNAVTGQFIDLALGAGAGHTSTTNLTYPWLIPAAEKDISKLLPTNVSISSSKIVGHKDGLVYIVSNLSNGGAFGVALNETNKLAFWYHNFPDGYDGFWAGYNS